MFFYCICSHTCVYIILHKQYILLLSKCMHSFPTCFSYSIFCFNILPVSVSQSVQLLSHVQLFATPWTVARQASLSITNSQSLLKLMSFESVMPSNHLIPCHPLLNFLLFSSCLLFFTASGSYPVSPFFTSDGQSVGASASASVLPVNSHWFPLGLTGLISLKCKGLSRVFFNTTVQKHHFFGAKPSLWFNCHIRTRLLEKP